jgi:hypothetical protein
LQRPTSLEIADFPGAGSKKLVLSNCFDRMTSFDYSSSIRVGLRFDTFSSQEYT